MIYETTVYWSTPPSGAAAAAISAKAAEMNDAGKTVDTTVTWVTEDPPVGRRHWVDEASAIEWRDFILPQGADSVNIQVVPGT